MPDNTRQHWSKEPSRLKEYILEQRSEHEHEFSEARVALGLCYAVPRETDVSLASRTQDYSSYRVAAHNLMHEAASSVQAFICANRLEAKITSIRGTHEAEMSAELFNQAVNQLLEEQNFVDIEAKAFLDSELCPKGFAMWEQDPLSKNMECTRLDPLYTFLHPRKLEATTVQYMDRRLVKARWGKTQELRDLIDRIPSDHPEFLDGVDSGTSLQASDDIAVYRGWLQDLGPKDPGSYVVQLDNVGTETCVLDKGPWNLPVPVFGMVYEDGFRPGEGRSLARTIVPYATRQNAFAKVKLDQLEGERSYIIRDEGVEFDNTNANWQDIVVPPGAKAPEVKVVSAVSGNIKEAEQQQHDQGLQEAGISPDFAGGEPPPAYSSQVAQLEWKKSLTQRLSQPQRHREQFWLDSTRILAAMLPACYKDRKVILKAANTGLWKEIEWSAISSENSFNISFQLRSGQSLTDSGRLELINTFKDSQVIDPLDVLANVANPDIQRLTERVLAPRRLIEWQICAARDHGKLISPCDMQDFAYGAKAAANAFQAAYMRGIYPRANMQKLWILWQLFVARTEQTQPVLPPEAQAAAEASGQAPEPTAGATPAAVVGAQPNQPPPPGAESQVPLSAETAPLPPL